MASLPAVRTGGKSSNTNALIVGKLKANYSLSYRIHLHPFAIALNPIRSDGVMGEILMKQLLAQLHYIHIIQMLMITFLFAVADSNLVPTSLHSPPMKNSALLLQFAALSSSQSSSLSSTLVSSLPLLVPVSIMRTSQFSQVIIKL